MRQLSATSNINLILSCRPQAWLHTLTIHAGAIRPSDRCQTTPIYQRPPMSSRTSTTPRRSSISRPSATSIRASTTQPRPCSRSASRPRRAARRACRGLRHAAQAIVFHALMEPGDEFVAARQLYGGSINQFTQSFKSSTGTYASPIPIMPKLSRGALAEDQGDLRRVDRQSRRHHYRHCRYLGVAKEAGVRSSSTIRSPRPICCCRSSTAPISSFIR